MIEPGAALAADTIHGAYGFEAEYRGEPFSFNQFEGKVTVIVNTASE
jgi:glutathione peroxidase-family protein